MTLPDPPSPVIVRRIVSGGQTGVDRGALDAAIDMGIPHGGWCPAGRRAEDGTIPARYQVTSIGSSDYAARTERNLLDSDGTLILLCGQLAGGTELTYRLALRHRKPVFIFDLDHSPPLESIRQWLIGYRIAVLNVAGPRESNVRGIAERTRLYLRGLFGPETPS